ncbi:MAG: dockerin type I repeat-containing protein, partial [Subdoligranulum sp.]|nr:dockerin type I repeat-containing protein [Subdoligranulum sp.]
AGMVSAEWHDLDSAFTGGEVLQLQFTALCDFTETTLEVQDVQLAAMQDGVAKKLTAKTAALTVSGGIQPGDLNRNGALDSGDLVKLSRLVAKLDTTDSIAKIAGDLNENGILDSGDLVKLCRLVAKLDPTPETTCEYSCSLR